MFKGFYFMNSLAFSYSTMDLVLKIGDGVIETLNGQLKSMIEQYLVKHPNITLNGFATKSGVGMTTLRRIVNLETKSGPAPHTTLAITSYVLKEKKLSRILDSVNGPVGTELSKVFGDYIEEELNYQSSDGLKELLEDKDNYLIYKLASNHSGVSENQIYDLLGCHGLNKMNELIEKGIVLRDKRKTIHSLEKNFSITLETAKKHSKELINFYKPEAIDKKRNLFYSQSESLSDEGIQKVKDIQRNAAKEVHKIMTNEKYFGINPYFSLQVCDTLRGREEEEHVLQ